jgi:hypothetical protein
MNTQMTPSVTTPTIATLYNEITGGLLKLVPDFQRRFVWTQPHQEEFLDTVLRGYPFPEIYVSEEEVDISAMKTVRGVIDGQQRLTTLKNYIEGKFDKPLTQVVPYDSLSDESKKTFLSYKVIVRDLGNVDGKTVREIFRRINLTKFKLDTVEIHNALYDGVFIQTAKSILDEADMSIYGVFRESEFSRMGDLHFILLIMSTVELGGFFSQDKEVEAMIERYNEDYPSSEETKATLLETFRIINSLGLPPDSMWFRKSNFFTMVCEFTLNQPSIPGDISARLGELESNVMSNKHQSANEFGKYYSYMYQGTNNRSARVVRSEMFRKYCLDMGG